MTASSLSRRPTGCFVHRRAVSSAKRSERLQSRRMRRIRNPVYGYPVTWVDSGRPAPHPSGHRRCRCSLRHPASAVTKSSGTILDSRKLAPERAAGRGEPQGWGEQSRPHCEQRGHTADFGFFCRAVLLGSIQPLLATPSPAPTWRYQRLVPQPQSAARGAGPVEDIEYKKPLTCTIQDLTLHALSPRAQRATSHSKTAREDCTASKA